MSKKSDRFEQRALEAAKAAVVELRMGVWAIEIVGVRKLEEDNIKLMGHVRFELARRAMLIRFDLDYDWDKPPAYAPTLEEVIYHEVFHVWLGTCGIGELGDAFNHGSTKEVQAALEEFTENACDGWAANFRFSQFEEDN